MTVSLRVLTLNCWGVFVKFAVEKRAERIAAIAEELSKGFYDIIILQEIWTQGDYEKICKKVLTAAKYTHYFHSSLIGSGVCLFSKHPILETLQFRFSLNGYAHKVQHGDWFGGKSVGLCQLLCDGVRVNVYGTHIHAQYHMTKDDYKAHRVVQAYEMSQFIKHTSETCDVVIVAGDFNMEPASVGIRMIKSNANLLDCWTSQKHIPEDDSQGMTCYAITNSFTKLPALDPILKPQRIDYIMYRYNSGYSVECQKCHVTMGKIPNEDFNYSDHEGVAAELVIKKNVTGMGLQRNMAEVEKNFTEALPVLEQGLRKSRADRVFYLVASFLCLMALGITGGMEMPWGLGVAQTLLRVIFTLGLGFSIWMGIVTLKAEMNGYQAAKKDINNLLKANTLTK